MKDERAQRTKMKEQKNNKIQEDSRRFKNNKIQEDSRRFKKIQEQILVMVFSAVDLMDMLSCVDLMLL